MAEIETLSPETETLSPETEMLANFSKTRRRRNLATSGDRDVRDRERSPASCPFEMSVAAFIRLSRYTFINSSLDVIGLE
jgi:hypothetical protein